MLEQHPSTLYKESKPYGNPYNFRQSAVREKKDVYKNVSDSNATATMVNGIPYGSKFINQPQGNSILARPDLEALPDDVTEIHLDYLKLDKPFRDKEELPQKSLQKPERSSRSITPVAAFDYSNYKPQSTAFPVKEPTRIQPEDRAGFDQYHIIEPKGILDNDKERRFEQPAASYYPPHGIPPTPAPTLEDQYPPEWPIVSAPTKGKAYDKLNNQQVRNKIHPHSDKVDMRDESYEYPREREKAQQPKFSKAPQPIYDYYHDDNLDNTPVTAYQAQTYVSPEKHYDQQQYSRQQERQKAPKDLQDWIPGHGGYHSDVSSIGSTSTARKIRDSYNEREPISNTNEKYYKPKMEQSAYDTIFQDKANFPADRTKADKPINRSVLPSRKVPEKSVEDFSDNRAFLEHSLQPKGAERNVSSFSNQLEPQYPYSHPIDQSLPQDARQISRDAKALPEYIGDIDDSQQRTEAFDQPSDGRHFVRPKGGGYVHTPTDIPSANVSRDRFPYDHQRELLPADSREVSTYQLPHDDSYYLKQNRRPTIPQSKEILSHPDTFLPLNRQKYPIDRTREPLDNRSPIQSGYLQAEPTFEEYNYPNQQRSSLDNEYPQGYNEGAPEAHQKSVASDKPIQQVKEPPKKRGFFANLFSSSSKVEHIVNEVPEGPVQEYDGQGKKPETKLEPLTSSDKGRQYLEQHQRSAPVESESGQEAKHAMDQSIANSYPFETSKSSYIPPTKDVYEKQKDRELSKVPSKQKQGPSFEREQKGHPSLDKQKIRQISSTPYDLSQKQQKTNFELKKDTLPRNMEDLQKRSGVGLPTSTYLDLRKGDHPHENIKFHMENDSREPYPQDHPEAFKKSIQPFDRTQSVTQQSQYRPAPFPIADQTQESYRPQAFRQPPVIQERRPPPQSNEPQVDHKLLSAQEHPYYDSNLPIQKQAQYHPQLAQPILEPSQNILAAASHRDLKNLSEYPSPVLEPSYSQLEREYDNIQFVGQKPPQSYPFPKDEKKDALDQGFTSQKLDSYPLVLNEKPVTDDKLSFPRNLPSFSEGLPLDQDARYQAGVSIQRPVISKQFLDKQQSAQQLQKQQQQRPIQTKQPQLQEQQPPQQKQQYYPVASFPLKDQYKEDLSYKPQYDSDFHQDRPSSIEIPRPSSPRILRSELPPSSGQVGFQEDNRISQVPIQEAYVTNLPVQRQLNGQQQSQRQIQMQASKEQALYPIAASGTNIIPSTHPGPILSQQESAHDKKTTTVVETGSQPMQRGRQPQPGPGGQSLPVSTVEEEADRAEPRVLSPRPIRPTSTKGLLPSFLPYEKKGKVEPVSKSKQKEQHLSPGKRQSLPLPYVDHPIKEKTRSVYYPQEKQKFPVKERQQSDRFTDQDLDDQYPKTPIAADRKASLERRPKSPPKPFDEPHKVPPSKLYSKQKELPYYDETHPMVHAGYPYNQPPGAHPISSSLYDLQNISLSEADLEAAMLRHELKDFKLVYAENFPYRFLRLVMSILCLFLICCLVGTAYVLILFHSVAWF